MRQPSGARSRVLLAKPGLDGHDRGAKVVAMALRDAGMEVIYTGMRKTAEEIVEAAIQEDVDIIGISIHSGAHITYAMKIANLLKSVSADDIPIVVGGVIPDRDIEPLKSIGVSAVLGPGTPLDVIVDTMKDLTHRRQI